MLPRLLVRIAGKIIARPIKRRLAAFDDATREPEKIQRELLIRILRDQQDTAFGRDHHFASIQTIEDYRRCVPVAPYEYVQPYIERVARGELSALVSDPIVHMFALTSGTTASRKLIPVTPRYLADYRRGWNIWGMQAMRHHKPIILRPMVQLAGDPEEYRTEAGIPCGNVSGFTAQVQKRVIRWLYSVPAGAWKIKDARTRYYVALRFSLTRRIGMMLAANPSTLVALARALDQDKERLIRDIADGTLTRDLDLEPGIRAGLTKKLKHNPARAAELEEFVLRRGCLLPSDCWPSDRLLLGTWTGGSVGLYLRLLPRYFADTPIRDLGLLASEGRMTLPLNDYQAGSPQASSGVLDITTHYFEFIPEAEIDSPQPTVLGAHELEEGKSYFIIPTTAAGLYRYQISDLIRVTGFHHATPLIEFLGKGHRFASLTGEKLCEHHVTTAMARVLAHDPQPIHAYTLAPCWDEDQPYYGLFLEERDVSDPESLEETGFARGQRLIGQLEKELAEQNLEYAAKRESGRLGPIRLQVVPNQTWSHWDKKRLEQTGGSPEQYKRPCLISDISFRESMPVLREIHGSPHFESRPPSTAEKTSASKVC